MAEQTSNAEREFDGEDPVDFATRRAAQLVALLQNTIGNSSESFHGLNDQIKDNYLWCCVDLARHLKDIVDRLPGGLRLRPAPGKDANP